MNKLNLVAALTFTLAIPTAARADDKPMGDKAAAKADKAAADATSGPDPADVLSKLHHANQMEIEAGKLAQEKGSSKAVKAYGKTLVRDHSAADKKVLATAKQL